MTELRLDFGCALHRNQLDPYAGQGYTALLVNMHETSSGVLYDMPMIADFCREQGILLIVDAISAFLADELDMAALGAAVVITGSQKALACSRVSPLSRWRRLPFSGSLRTQRPACI